MDRFLNVAQRLKLDGLLTPQSDEDTHEAYNQNYKEDIQSVSNDDSEAKLPVEKKIVNPQISLNETVSIPEDLLMEDVKMKVLEYIEKDDGGNSRCKFCGTVRMGRNHFQNMKKHVEIHLDGISCTCKICGKQFRSFHSLNSHKSSYHR